MKNKKTFEYIFHQIQNDFPNLSKSDILSIIENISKSNMNDIILNSKFRLGPFSSLKLWIIFKKLKKGIPLSYILKSKYFFGLNFIVNKNVLIPRQESELIVDCVSRLIKKKQDLNILDLCSGSGCLGISLLKYNFNQVNKLIFSDVSKKANRVCKKNIKKFKLSDKCQVINGDFIKPFQYKEQFDVIMCNPPYIDFNDKDIDYGVKKHEPSISLYADEKGLYFYKELILNLDSIVKDKNNFIVVMEIGWNQKEDIEIFLNKIGWIKWEFKKDYSNNWRILIISDLGEENEKNWKSF